MGEALGRPDLEIFQLAGALMNKCSPLERRGVAYSPVKLLLFFVLAWTCAAAAKYPTRFSAKAASHPKVQRRPQKASGLDPRSSSPTYCPCSPSATEPLWLLSTPEGQRGYFHSEWADATNGTIDGPLSADQWVRIRVTAQGCEKIKPKFLQTQKIRLGERRFAQEYECTFIDTRHNIFHPEATRNAFRDDIKPFVA